ncbi:MAG TPA: nuclear transport factor 2 family protein [Microvirga sp.]|nr:nuclear transport factor 2 family protein [Microvirga sp.]
MSNIDVVRSAYESFKRGDIPAILDLLAEDVEWQYGPISTDVPWLQHHRGRDEVRRFFEALTGLDFHQLDTKTFLGSGDLVVALLDVRATVKATGREIVERDLPHIFYFRDGKVVRYRQGADTHQQYQATRRTA